MKLQFITLIFSATLMQQTFSMLDGTPKAAFNWETEIKKCNQIFKPCTNISLTTALTGVLAVGIPTASYILKQAFATLSQSSANCIRWLESDAHMYHQDQVKQAHIGANNACINSRDLSQTGQSICNGVFYASTTASIGGLLYWLYNKYTIVRRDQMIGIQKRAIDSTSVSADEKSESAPLLDTRV